MVCALVPGESGQGSSPGRGHCVVFLGKTLNSHSASLQGDTGKLLGKPNTLRGSYLGGGGGGRNTPSLFMLQKPG